MSKTFGEQFKEAIACNTEDEAQKWFEKEMRRYIKEFGKKPDEAREIILHNIGYMAGYYGNEEQQKIYKLFNAPHPIFGVPPIKVSPEKAFEMGKEIGEKLKQVKDNDNNTSE